MLLRLYFEELVRTLLVDLAKPRPGSQFLVTRFGVSAAKAARLGHVEALLELSQLLGAVADPASVHGLQNSELWSLRRSNNAMSSAAMNRAKRKQKAESRRAIEGRQPRLDRIHVPACDNRFDSSIVHGPRAHEYCTSRRTQQQVPSYGE